MTDEEIVQKLEQQRDGEINTGDGIFEGKKEETEASKEKKEDTKTEASEEKKETFDEKIVRLGSSPDELIGMLMSLSDDGWIEESFEVMGGRFKGSFRSPTLIASRESIDILDSKDIESQISLQYHINLNAVSTVLFSYNGVELDGNITERRDWIENNIPTVIFNSISVKAGLFHSKLSLLNDDGVDLFFSSMSH